MHVIKAKQTSTQVYEYKPHTHIHPQYQTNRENHAHEGANTGGLRRLDAFLINYLSKTVALFIYFFPSLSSFSKEREWSKTNKEGETRGKMKKWKHKQM